MIKSSTVQLFADRFVDRGHKVHWINSQALVIDCRGGKRTMIQWTRSALNDTAASRLASNKRILANRLRKVGISVPDGKHFETSQLSQAFDYGKTIYPCIAKPVRSHGHGRGCTVGIKDDKALKVAIDLAAKCDRAGIMVQREYFGREARIMIVDGKVVSVLEKLPGRNGYIGGRETGITYRQIIDKVHPSYINISLKAARMFPGLDASGLDMKAYDFSKPATPGNHVLIEMNTGMGIIGHHKPDHGRPIDVAGMMVDAILRKIGASKT